MPPGPAPFAKPHPTNWFLKYRKTWLLGIVGLAVGLNLLYWVRAHASNGDTGLLLKLKRSAARLEKQEVVDQSGFLNAGAAAAGAGAAAAGSATAGTTTAATTAAGAVSGCHTEQDAEYDGEEVLKWGSQFSVGSAEECCDACRAAAGCNVWVYCGATGDGVCPGDRKPQECWLKRKAGLNVVKPQGTRVPGSRWVSGALYSEDEHRQALVEEALEKKRKEDELTTLRNNETLPLVFFNVTIKGRPVGVIEMVLFTDISPRSAENFRQLCTGEHGVVPEGKEGAGKPYHFKGANFYRIIHNFIDQAGIYVDSVFGGQFNDDPGGLKLRHTKKGLLSQANMGPDTNTAHFSIMMGPAPHLDGHYTIFGQVVSGFEVVDTINALSIGKQDNTAGVEEEVLIADSGQIRKGTLVPDLTLGACGSKCPELGGGQAATTA
ncbi:hypothetical protein N2152v2_008407 [Parachlorella kessleri]